MGVVEDGRLGFREAEGLVGRGLRLAGFPAVTAPYQAPLVVHQHASDELALMHLLARQVKLALFVRLVDTGRDVEVGGGGGAWAGTRGFDDPSATAFDGAFRPWAARGEDDDLLRADFNGVFRPCAGFRRGGMVSEARRGCGGSKSWWERGGGERRAGEASPSGFIIAGGGISDVDFFCLFWSKTKYGKITKLIGQIS